MGKFSAVFVGFGGVSHTFGLIRRPVEFGVFIALDLRATSQCGQTSDFIGAADA